MKKYTVKSKTFNGTTSIYNKALTYKQAKKQAKKEKQQDAKFVKQNKEEKDYLVNPKTVRVVLAKPKYKLR